MLDQLGKLEAIVKEYIKEGKYTEAVNTLQTFLNDFNPKSVEEELKYTLIYAKALNKLQEFYKVNNLIESILEKNKAKIDKKSLIYIDLVLELGYSYHRVGMYDETIELGDQLLNIIRLIRNDKEEVRSRHYAIERLLGAVYFKKGNKNEAAEHVRMSFEIAKEIEDVSVRISSAANLGTSLYILGDFRKALSYNYEALKYKEHMSKETLATIYNNISIIYREQGRLDLALEAQEKSLELKKELNIPDIAISYNALGSIYLKMGRYTEAIDFLEKAYEITQTTKIKRVFTDNIYELILALWQDGQKKRARHYFEILQGIVNEYPDYDFAILTHDLLEALFLKQSTNIEDVAKAKKLLKKLIKEGKLRFSRMVTAYVNLVDILLIELNIFKDDTLVNEINEILQELIHLSEKNNSYQILVQSKLLSSQLYLINLDYNSARKILIEVESIAEEKGMTGLAKKASALHDTLLHQFESMEKLVREKLELSGRMKYSYFDNILREIVSPKFQIPTIISETPKLFIILNSNYSPIYNFGFLEDRQEADYYLKEFISVVQSSQIMNIERVRIKDFTVLLRRDKSLTFCYIFAGDSYTAKLKLEIVIETLKGMINIWNGLDGQQTELTEIQESLITNILRELFEKGGEGTRIKEMDKQLADLPNELTKFKVMLNPIRLALIKLLYHNYKLPASELREMIGITWGSWQKHLQVLEKEGLVRTNREFINTRPRVMVSLNEEGNKIYSRLQKVLKSY
ncbi:MAG: tetratricopeptide repeat protein [Candidatus Hodarchaeales archaeon]